ncbi:NEDD4 family-interacting protein 1-like [Anastrepha obliqua]|uniref:NEDD4 family-interacting protein 1-like n=1 Tax=Anastrepha obliqua TaxID=95512 RepID=UPI00240A7D8E|nr:NEDD4 family-interacting protein 1-like [Anastrepha obliqua]XP_054732504.1 NEDD4 family-interacting protein 1-like [Anastrepha obliqua]XP_054732505.1 NEDD4 family-interacting protein 1-like [Anastrepha obliqua]XP_054732506.1 NEDD4 family-interacting protein 1-like [Anastrepha obliqua]XP_054732507.1 NEDD4 family-interacting protein 1-like [Anastrepha obliqua]
MPDNQQAPPSSHGEELGPPKADFSAPPPYELTNNGGTVIGTPQQQLQQQNSSPQQPPPVLQVSLPPINASTPGGVMMVTGDVPIMQHAAKLPTYEEVQMEKSLNGELPPPFMNAHVLQPPPLPPPNPLLAHIRDGVGNMPGAGTNSVGTSPALTFIAIDASEAENLTSTTDNSLLGTDIMFIMAFMVAFLFNWIGFLMLTCFCHTIAARYGALSGFGLSLAKWTLIVKNSTELASHENSWLWWLIMAFGFLICVRALIQYVSIKRTWRLLSTSAQERLLFFY